jgi:hypothetical protein
VSIRVAIEAHTEDGLRAIINFTAIRKRPPVSRRDRIKKLAGQKRSASGLVDLARILTAKDHSNVFFFCWTSQGVPPEEI